MNSIKGVNLSLVIMKYLRSLYSKVTFRKAFFFLPVFISLCAYSQQPYYKKITAQKGLPSSTIYDLFTSNRGFLYLGLETGLSRFNGTKFILYPMLDNKSRSVNAIQEDSRGVIWCMNFTNQLFHLENDTLKPHYLINETINSSGPLRDFVVHELGIYFLTERALFLFTNEEEIVKLSSVDTTHFGNSYLSLVKSHDEQFLYVLDVLNAYKLDLHRNINIYKELPLKQCVAAVHKGELVFSLKTSLNELFLEGKKIKNQKKFNRFYVNKIVSIQNDLWFCTNSGLAVFNSNSLKEFALPNTRITDIVQDFEGGYWISSVDRGLFYVPNITTQFINLSDYNVNAVEAGPNNSFFAGTGNGEIYHFSADGALIKKIATTYNSEVEFIFFDSIQDRLITSHGLVDLKKSYEYKPARFGKNIVCDSLGNFLINTYNQAVILNKDFKSPPIIPPSFSTQSVFDKFSELSIPFYSLYQNRSSSGCHSSAQNAYFIGAFDGLYKIGFQNTSEEILYNGVSTVVIGMSPTQYDKVWLATQRHGVLMLEKDIVSLYINKSLGLSSNTCRKVIERDGFLFVLTDIGLDMVNLLTRKVTRLTEIMSLGDITMYDFDIVQNKIRIATDVGILSIGIPQQYKLYQPRIDRLMFYSLSDGIQTPIQERKQLTNKSIKFKVETINYKNADVFQFSYRLMGLDTNWHLQASKDNEFSFIALPSGSYTFELRTKINDEYSAKKSISFSIKKPFLETFWFYLILIFSVILLATLVFRKILAQQRRKQLIKQRLLQSQLVSLRSQMNPHFMFNIMNSVQGLIYSDKRTEASTLLGKMSTLMRSVLEISDQANISIEKELELLKNYIELEAARFDDDFVFSLETNISKDEQSTQIPSLIIQPFIENAIKHGLSHKKGLKKLRVQVLGVSDQKIVIIIEDNGIGRKASRKINLKRINHKSFAGEAIESRISLINKSNSEFQVRLKIHDLKSEDDTSKGTKIVIEIIKR